MLREPSRVKARKRHTCDWCHGTIERGERYTLSTFVGDSIYDWHECDRCHEYVREMWCWHYKYGGRRTDALDTEYFMEFMREEHPDVLEKWEEGDKDGH